LHQVKQNLRNKVYESPFQLLLMRKVPIAIVRISSTHLITNLLLLSVSPLYWLFSKRCNTLICSLIFFSVMTDIFWSVNMSSSTSDDIALQSLQSLRHGYILETECSPKSIELPCLQMLLIYSSSFKSLYFSWHSCICSL
jgi:hypothetical protein